MCWISRVFLNKVQSESNFIHILISAKFFNENLQDYLFRLNSNYFHRRRFYFYSRRFLSIMMKLLNMKPLYAAKMCFSLIEQKYDHKNTIKIKMTIIFHFTHVRRIKFHFVLIHIESGIKKFSSARCSLLSIITFCNWIASSVHSQSQERLIFDVTVYIQYICVLYRRSHFVLHGWKIRSERNFYTTLPKKWR